MTIPGFYRRRGARSPPSSAGNSRGCRTASAPTRSSLACRSSSAKSGYTAWEQRSARPTFEINGLTSGYQGEGSKTIIPSWASAKLTFRLVPNQKPAPDRAAASSVISNSFARPPCAPKSRAATAARPTWFDPRGPQAQAALRALQTAFGHEPVLLREGGSIPIVTEFKRSSAPTRCCSDWRCPMTTRIRRTRSSTSDNYAAGMRLGAALWPELAAV